jgi:hypothetical protein
MNKTGDRLGHDQGASAAPVADSLAELYESDETAWLEISADLIESGRGQELDLPNLAEFLLSMAKRDRREVQSRLRTLLAHLLKWLCQADKRTPSWQATIDEQRAELADLLESKTLRRHAEEVLPQAYDRAVKLALAETQLERDVFPAGCPFTLDDLIREEQ